jgi:hypothetical protein
MYFHRSLKKKKFPTQKLVAVNKPRLQNFPVSNLLKSSEKKEFYFNKIWIQGFNGGLFPLPHPPTHTQKKRRKQLSL